MTNIKKNIFSILFIFLLLSCKFGNDRLSNSAYNSSGYDIQGDDPGAGELEDANNFKVQAQYIEKVESGAGVVITKDKINDKPKASGFLKIEEKNNCIFVSWLDSSSSKNLFKVESSNIESFKKAMITDDEYGNSTFKCYLSKDGIAYENGNEKEIKVKCNKDKSVDDDENKIFFDISTSDDDNEATFYLVSFIKFRTYYKDFKSKS